MAKNNLKLTSVKIVDHLFEDIKVSVSNNTLFVKLIEYPIINEIIIVGETANKFKEQIKKQIKSKKNGPFIKSLISDDETTIKKLYSSLGFNFVEVKSKVEKFPNKIVNVYFEFDKGEITKISNIFSSYNFPMTL